MKKEVFKWIVVLLILSSVFMMVAGCKKETEAYQQWKEVLIEYEAWVDDYIAFMKKYSSSSNTSAMMNDYTKLLSQEAEWANKLAGISNDSEMTRSERNKVLKEYNRITLKMTKGALQAYGY